VVVQAYASLGVGLTAANAGAAAMAKVRHNTRAVGEGADAAAGTTTAGAVSAAAAAQPQPQLLDHPTVLAIAARRGCGSAEVLLLWALQQSPPVPVIPKSVCAGRIATNAAARHAAPLSAPDLAALNSLESGHKFAWDPSVVP
jgi:diketogulonate reductase-like aldo/keto reductase